MDYVYVITSEELDWFDEMYCDYQQDDFDL